MEKHVSLLFLIVLLSTTISAAGQGWYYEDESVPTNHDYSAKWYLTGGYQRISHETGPYDVATLQIAVIWPNLYSGSRIGITYGKDYISFSPFGVLMFLPAWFMSNVNYANSLDEHVGFSFLLLGVSSFQFRIPLSDHIEIDAGWDALRITKMKNYNNTYYAAGSVNAGLMVFLGDNLFVNPYWEYHHPHNKLINAINWCTNEMYGETVFSNQPEILKGHTFGVRLGLMF